MGSQKELRKIPYTQKVALSVGFVAIGVVLSPIFNIPVPPIKAYPLQHMINIIQAIWLGPLYAVINATIIGIIRNMLGTGTFFAFPGGIPGGLVVGLVYWYLWKSDWAAFTENLGTVCIGATISYIIVSPLPGKVTFLGFMPAGPPPPQMWGIPGMWALWAMFAISCIPGSILGFIVVKALRFAGLITT